MKQYRLGSLYTKRFGEVSQFCCRLQKILPLIRCCWDESKYVFGPGPGSARDAEFQPHVLTSVCRPPALQLFSGYLDMVCQLHSIAQ
eukprot:5052200-Pyramimonas_sp.AAC.1